MHYLYYFSFGEEKKIKEELKKQRVDFHRFNSKEGKEGIIFKTNLEKIKEIVKKSGIVGNTEFQIKTRETEYVDTKEIYIQSKFIEEIKKIKEKKREIFKGDRTAYIEECSKRVELMIKKTKEELKRKNKDIEALKSQLEEDLNTIESLKRKINYFVRQNQQEGQKEYGEEFDKLIDLPDVRAVRVNKAEKKINVFTNTLFCRNPKTNKHHEIGKFRIEIPTEANAKIKCINLDHCINVDGKRHAPHIANEMGEPCFGNISSSVTQLIKNYEFFTLVTVVIKFIESVNTKDSLWSYIKEWPEVSLESMNKIKRKESKEVDNRL